MTVPTWSAFARDTAYQPDGGLPILDIRGMRPHLGVATAVLTTPYSAAAWARVGPGRGVILQRDTRQQLSGRTIRRQATWDADTGRAVIKVTAAGDLRHTTGRRVWPDPGRLVDDQTVNDYWTHTGAASTALQRLISDQLGPTCRADRRIAGLYLGDDPGVGLSRKWTGLPSSTVLELATDISVASGANLGLRSSTSTDGLRVDVVQPRDLAAGIRFSADLSNLVGFDYIESAPEVTDGVAAGQGDLKTRIRRVFVTSDPVALQWGERRWTYVDRRDTADTTDLLAAATDAVADGAPTVNLTVSLTDSQAATYGRDWDLGDRVTVHVGLPGDTKPATVVDVVREIAFTVDADGAESITPAIGTYDAKAVIPTPTQARLTQVGRALGDISRK